MRMLKQYSIYEMRMQSILPSPEFARPVWRKSEIIRHITTGKPFLVLHIFIDSCTMAVDLESKASPSLPVLILPRDYDQYGRDTDMECEQTEDNVEWSYSPITI